LLELVLQQPRRRLAIGPRGKVSEGDGLVIARVAARRAAGECESGNGAKADHAGELAGLHHGDDFLSYLAQKGAKKCEGRALGGRLECAGIGRLRGFSIGARVAGAGAVSLDAAENGSL